MEQVISNIISMEEVKKKKEVNGKVEMFFHITQKTTKGRDCFVRVSGNKDITSDDIRNIKISDLSDLLDEMGVEWEGEETFGMFEDVVKVEPDFVKEGGELGLISTHTYDCSLIRNSLVKNPVVG